MQWRALICGCSIRTSHPCALPTTVLLRITCISTAAPGSALRCSMTVGGTTRSRRLMAVPAQRPVAGCSCWRARASRRRALSAARPSAGTKERTARSPSAVVLPHCWVHQVVLPHCCGALGGRQAQCVAVAVRVPAPKPRDLNVARAERGGRGGPGRRRKKDVNTTICEQRLMPL